eukprot:15348096-Ditylum_brightwellii.AAC.1
MSNASKTCNMTKTKSSPPPIKKYPAVTITIADQMFQTYANIKYLEVDNKFNYKEYTLEFKHCLMAYKESFLAQENKEIKELYGIDIKLGNFLSFFKTEEGDNNMIQCTEYNIERHLDFCHNMGKQVDIHCIVNGLHHLTIQSPITSNSKILKSNTNNEDNIKPTPDIKPNPVTSKDINQNATP